MTRIAIVERAKCNKKKCSLECIKFCPVNRTSDDEPCVDLDEETGKAKIIELLCTGCGICIRKCPRGAIQIINLPDELETDLVHRYGRNGFKLYRLPKPKPGHVLGLIGQNGAGKSTSLKILSGQLKPNLGKWDEPPEWDAIIDNFKGSELQNYFSAMQNEELKTAIKPQEISGLPKITKGVVKDLIIKVDEKGMVDEVKALLSLETFWERELSILSGGELQRVAIAATIVKDADVYLFDEPSSFLDVKERINAANAIRTLIADDKYVINVEHDLAVCDAISDQISMYYGSPGGYGIVTHPRGVRDGINVFLDGFIPDENMRFRDYSIRFSRTPAPSEGGTSHRIALRYGKFAKDFNGFSFLASPGIIHAAEVIGIIGPNGIGKTTFAKILAGDVEATKGEVIIEDNITPTSEKSTDDTKKEDKKEEKVGFKIAHKPQYISLDFDGSVEEFFLSINSALLTDPWTRSEIIRPLNIESLLTRDVKDLSGGELQKIAIAGTLAQKCDMYLLDEPSAFLDSETRMVVAKVIQKIIRSRTRSAFVIDHDLMFIDYLSDNLMVFEGDPGIKGKVKAPTNLRRGMNRFLKAVDITFRRDKVSGRPRVNKKDSRLDRAQRDIGEFYYVPSTLEKE
ncbi:MAG: ribosome biogenesis/translation initiation ATPase RLI [Candidatus Heimdallarchaeota archaeon]